MEFEFFSQFTQKYKKSQDEKPDKSSLKQQPPKDPPSQDTLKRLAKIKSLIDEPQESSPEIRFSKIQEQMNEAVCHETIRQERFNPTIYCPYCYATNVERLAYAHQISEHNYRYECLNCGEYFNDDSDTPFEQDNPPLHIWMQVWYLIGCTSSYQYIASKLNMDLATVEHMILQLQRTFKVTRPLTKFKSFEEWEQKLGLLYKKKIKGMMAKRKDLLAGESTEQPSDTAEHRKQRDKRRDPTKSPRTSPNKPRSG